MCVRFLVYIINYDINVRNNNNKQYKHVKETLKCNPSPQDFRDEPKLSQGMGLESFCKVHK